MRIMTESRIRTYRISHYLLLLMVLLLPAVTTATNGLLDESHNSASEPADGHETGLVLEAADGSGQLAAELLEMQVSMQISGMLVRTRLTQRFRNPTDQWLQGLYRFPLPDNASVDEMRMQIGERSIKAVVQTRDQARQTFNQAVQQGRQSSLVEQQRPNLYQSEVANIAPQSEISVTIAFQSRARYVDGHFSLRFPMTLTPRYIPEPLLAHSNHVDGTLQSNGNGWAYNSQPVDNPAGISPPFTDAAFGVRGSFDIQLAAGIPLQTVDSPSHAIVANATGNAWHISLAEQTIAADRDFELNWIPQAGSSPLASVFTEHNGTGEESFASIMLVPPQDLFDQAPVPRELIFVVDTSGSMDGQPIIQARTALMLAIQRLKPVDRFNVIEFNDQATALHRLSVEASSDNIRHALNRVRNLYAGGGTEIGRALQLAVEQPVDNERMRQIVFITDGSVGNEAAIFDDISNQLGNSRLFTVGIGSAPNTWFMRKAAELGRGSYTFIARETEISEKMLALFKKLESPVLTNLQLEWHGVPNPEMYPQTIPDLYIGQPILADARWQQPIHDGELSVSGEHNGRAWQRRLSLKSSAPATPDNSTPAAPGSLAKTWAARKIESLTDQMTMQSYSEDLESQITELGLSYGLITRYTSLVAVAEVAARDPLSDAMQVVDIPASMPAGNTMAFPQGSLDLKYQLLLSSVFFSMSVLFGLATLAQVRLR